MKFSIYLDGLAFLQAAVFLRKFDHLLYVRNRESRLVNGIPFEISFIPDGYKFERNSVPFPKQRTDAIGGYFLKLAVIV